jgi:hypothetical protein
MVRDSESNAGNEDKVVEDLLPSSAMLRHHLPLS